MDAQGLLSFFDTHQTAIEEFDLASGELNFVLKGFGRKVQKNKLRLVLDDTSVKFRTTRKLYFGLNYFALEELNFSGTCTNFTQPKYRHFNRFRKILAIGFYRRNFVTGIFSGFEARITVKASDVLKPPFLQVLGEAYWMARSAGRHGILLPDYEDSIEYNIRLNENDEILGILSAKVYPRLNISRKRQREFQIKFDNLVDAIASQIELTRAESFSRILPNWHHGRSFFSLIYDLQKEFGSENIFKKSTLSKSGSVFDLKFTPSPKELSALINFSPRTGSSAKYFQAAHLENVELYRGVNVVVSDYLVTTDTSSFFSLAKWPSNAWSTIFANVVAIPAIREETLSISDGLFIPSSPNWHHFLEDILPRLYLCADMSDELTVLISEFVKDASQIDAIHQLSDKVFVLEAKSKTMVERLKLSFFSDERYLSSSQSSLSTGNVDLEIMSKMISALINIEEPNQIGEAKYVYIQRGPNTFRTLINRGSLEKLLKKQGFKFISAELMTLKEKIAMFHNCNLIVVESGAGFANAYLAANSTVIELRSPGHILSTEHLGAVITGNLKYHSIEGTTVNAISRLRFGQDAWRISMSDMRKLLLENLSE